MSADIESEKNDSVGTVTLLWRQAKSGSNDVFDQLFAIYFQRLVRIARHRLPATRDRRVLDEEDLAVQVLASFFVDLQTGKDIPLKSRTDVQHMLARRLQQRAANQVRDAHREKRGGGKVSGESVFRDGQGQPDPVGINQVVDPMQAVEELHQTLLESLEDPLLRSIGEMWLGGASAEVIVEATGKSRPTVYRKMNLIREAWQNAAASSVGTH